MSTAEPQTIEVEKLHRPSRWSHGTLLVVSLAAAKLLIQMITAHRYGYFRDELYYLDLSRHPDWGYLDLPP